MKGERKTPNPLIAILFLLVLVAIFLASNKWQEPPSIPNMPNTDLTNKVLVEPQKESYGLETAINSLIKILIVKWGFETALFVVSITAAVLTIVLLAKLGIEGKHVVRGGTVTAIVAGYYIATFNPISYLLIIPVSIILILAAFSFSFSNEEKIEISEEGRKESKRTRMGFKD